LKILLIADDLTGGLDASVAFAARGMSVICGCAPETLSDAINAGADVVAISTNSRELPETQALERLATLLDVAMSAPDWNSVLMFKKVDSRLKGHVAAELRLLSTYRSSIIVCPAVPRLGRYVRNGSVCGAGIDVPIRVSAKIGTPEVLTPDAASQQDLDDVVAAADSATLFVGAAGLAEAVARRMVPVFASPISPKATTPALFAIGSQDPVTLAQLVGFDAIAGPGGILCAPTSGPESIQMLRITEGSDPVSAATATRNFATSIAVWLDHRRPATLLSCGGETTAAILRAVSCTLVRVEAEILPGLPVSRLVDGIPGLAIITKSGGFGHPDTLHEVVRRLTKDWA